jgi:hypothetical protein
MLIIIIAIVGIIAIMFISDSDKVSKKNMVDYGGLMNKHAAFVSYCKTKPKVQLSKNSGTELEYKIPCTWGKDTVQGYIYLGLQDKFTLVAFCRAESLYSGYKCKGFMKEIKDWRDMDEDDYRWLLEELQEAMFETDEFAKLSD